MSGIRLEHPEQVFVLPNKDPHELPSCYQGTRGQVQLLYMMDFFRELFSIIFA